MNATWKSTALYANCLLLGLVVSLSAWSAPGDEQIPKKYLQPWPMATTELLWEVSDLRQAKAVVFDPVRKRFYVSTHEPGDSQNGGAIAVVSRTGRLTHRDWIKGLATPRGMAVHKDRLYVADGQALVVIDIKSAAVVSRFSAPDARGLNDVVVDRQGRVYVADLLGDAIYRLDLRDNSKTLRLWLQDARLNGPAGLFMEHDRLVVATWGRRSNGLNTSRPGNLKTVSLQDARIGDLGDGSAVGNLNGVQFDGVGCYLATDARAGRFFHVWPHGEANLILELSRGSGDMAYLPAERLAVIPLESEDKVVAYRVRY